MATFVAVGGISLAVKIYNSGEQICDYQRCYPDPAAKMISRFVGAFSLGLAGLFLRSDV
ncbi:hypothetical protein [[Limnothrix rosea] IAM M-220]|uniref:hypothetical protein n=1 Tax=[Limnothrix rosea] IAM M-220 TaxID=454133 RepID=UPI0015C55F32|nr:hypothetical protein [[Limnothrix rosea] IAM M-220]